MLPFGEALQAQAMLEVVRGSRDYCVGNPKEAPVAD